MVWDVPLSFAFRWCTDYRSDDASRSRETYLRRIVSRSRRRVVFEDVWPLDRGWGWRRADVTLTPPDRWHADSLGSVRDASIDYRLTALSPDRTRFDVYMRRRPSTIHPEQPSRPAWEKDVGRLWSNFARAMARDFRRSRPGRTSRRTARTSRR